MSDEKKPRLFIRNPQSGEPWAYCGDASDLPALKAAFGEYAAAESEELRLGRDTERVTLEIRRSDMTDAEVNDLPEM